MGSQIRIDGVRGASHSPRAPTGRMLAGGLAFDLALGLGTVAVIATALRIQPAWNPLIAGFVILGVIGSELLLLGLGVRTAAMRVFDLQRDGESPSLLRRYRHLAARDRERRRREQLSATALLGALYLPLLIFWLSHPMLKSAAQVSVSTFVPEQNQGWNELAFFYGTSLFPREFEGHTVLLTLPYAKGPPARFVEKIVLRLRVPDITLTLEGPKTPEASSSRERAQWCMRAPWDPTCLRLRSELVWRHSEEMRAHVGAARYTLQWFKVSGAREPLQGLRIVARGLQAVEERYLLFNSLGTPQSISLVRPVGASGDQASELVEQIVRAARIEDTLIEGRARANARLAETSLARAQKARDSVALTRALADAQSALISKISVDPKEVETYYHLGGVALLLAKHAAGLRARPADAGTLDLDAWLTTAKVLARSAYLYAQDISPAHPDTRRLHDIWLEAKGL